MSARSLKGKLASETDKEEKKYKVVRTKVGGCPVVAVGGASVT